MRSIGGARLLGAVGLEDESEEGGEDVLSMEDDGSCTDEDDALEFAEQQLLMQLFYDRKQQAKRQGQQQQHGISKSHLHHGDHTLTGHGLGSWSKGVPYSHRHPHHPTHPDPGQPASLLHHAVQSSSRGVEEGSGNASMGSACGTPPKDERAAAAHDLMLQSSAAKQVCPCSFLPDLMLRMI